MLVNLEKIGRCNEANAVTSGVSYPVYHTLQYTSSMFQYELSYLR